MKLILIQEVKLQVEFPLSEVLKALSILDFILFQILEYLHRLCWLGLCSFINQKSKIC